MLRVKQERERANLTQQELAHRAGISMRTLSYLETNGRNPRIDTVRKVADALGVPFQRLLEEGAA